MDPTFAKLSTRLVLAKKNTGNTNKKKNMSPYPQTVKYMDDLIVYGNPDFL